MAALVEYGTDPRVPALPVVPDPRALGGILVELLPPSAKRVQDVQVRVLRDHPGKRCVFEIAWRGHAPGAPSWIGKVYAADRSDVYQTMRAIAAAGFGPDAEFSIPEPVAYLPELRLLLQENVVGPSATEGFVAADEDDRLAMSARCAAWLARFHTAAPLSGPTLALAQWRLSIERWSLRIAGVGGALAEKAERLHGLLELAVPKIRDIGPRASHGSFTHHQVIAPAGRTVTFDWDDHAVADPGYDVARFAVGLRRLAWRCLGSIRALDRAADAFLDTYHSRCGREVTANLSFYSAAICLRLAKKDISHQAAGWFEKAEATLDEGLRVLEEGV